jgi:hypothetical protein
MNISLPLMILATGRMVKEPPVRERIRSRALSRLHLGITCHCPTPFVSGTISSKTHNEANCSEHSDMELHCNYKTNINLRKTTMKRAKFIKQISLGVVFCVFAAIAPRVANAQDDLQAASEAIRNQKRIYIEKVMELTPQEEDAFWRLYAEYDSGLAKIAEKRITLATNFIASQGTLSDAKALDMLNEKLRIDGDELIFKQSYVAKFQRILPGRMVVRFYQTENRFDTAATAELYRNIPVIR